MPDKVKKNTTYIGDDGCVVRIGRHCEIVDAITTEEYMAKKDWWDRKWAWIAME
jgi:hypothetical protein